MSGFKKDSAGNWQFQLDYPFFVFQKSRSFRKQVLQYGPVYFRTCGYLGLTVVLWPVSALVRKHYDRKLDYSPSESKLRLLVRAVCILLLLFFVGWSQSFH